MAYVLARPYNWKDYIKDFKKQYDKTRELYWYAAIVRKTEKEALVLWISDWQLNGGEIDSEWVSLTDVKEIGQKNTALALKSLPAAQKALATYRAASIPAIVPSSLYVVKKSDFTERKKISQDVRCASTKFGLQTMAPYHEGEPMNSKEFATAEIAWNDKAQVAKRRRIESKDPATTPYASMKDAAKFLKCSLPEFIPATDWSRAT